MTNSNSKFTTVVIKNAQIWWTKLDKPVDPFGAGPAYEVQVRTSDEAQATEWKGMGLNVKKMDDYFKVSLKRKATNKNGTENKAPDIYINDIPATDAEKRSIGNGSIANIRCFQYDYSVGGRSGTATQFNAIKVTELKSYEGGSDEIDF